MSRKTPLPAQVEVVCAHLISHLAGLVLWTTTAALAPPFLLGPRAGMRGGGGLPTWQHCRSESIARCSSSSSETLAGSLPRLLGGGRESSSAASSFAVTLRARLAA
jgi:hypothetical protein